MKRIQISLAILLIICSTNTFAEEIWANSLSPSDIQSAVNSASPGDVVILPTGTYNNFNTQVNVPNGISMRGQGKNVTILNSSGTNRMFSWNSSGVSSSYPVEISGFKITGRGAGTSNSGYGIRITKLIDFSIHDIEFRDFCGTGISITEGRGVIYNCDFFDIYPADLGMMGYGISVHGDDVWDNPKPPLGTQNAIFVEDNRFFNCKHGVDSNEDGRYVARYNEFHEPHSNRGMVVVHGKQSQHNSSGNTWEIYENTLYGDPSRTDDWGITVRGGSGVIWNNTCYDLQDIGGHKAVGFSIDDHGTYPADYPDPYQVRDSFVWQNTLNGSSSPINVRITSNALSWIQNGRDYFMYQKGGYTPFPYPHPLRSSGTVSASISASPTSGIAPLIVDFAGSATGGTPPYTYSWSFGDGGSSSLQNPSHTYSSTGDYAVALTVTDSENNQDSSYMTINVSNEHEVSTPNTPTGPITGFANNQYSFSTGGASCSQGHNIEYRFSWGSDQFSNWSSSSTASHIWTEPGSYWVMVRARCVNDTDIRSDWSAGFTITISEPAIHSITTPNTPTGPITGSINNSYSFSTGGASCSQGHNIEYRFSWGSDQFSNWSSSTTASHTWTEPGSYWVMVRARCTDDTNIRSDWSAGFIITISSSASHSVAPPNEANGPSVGDIDTSYSFSTGGASCSLGHNVQYRFDWGDGSSSNWSSSTSASHAWTNTGDYTVRVRARCASDTSITSAWTTGNTISITNQHMVSTPSAPNSPSSGFPDVLYTYSTGGASCSMGHNIEYRFDWGDGSNSSWSSTNSASHSWSSTGTYEIKAQSRCSVNNSVVSAWSEGKTIQITEETASFDLSVSSQTSAAVAGEGGATNPPSGTYSYPSGNTIQLTATPNPNFRFSKWTGDVSGTEAFEQDINLVVNRDKTITAQFYTQCGDVNGDLLLSPKDAQDSFDIFLGRISNPTEAQKENADVNCDGTSDNPKVTPMDSHAIFKKYLGKQELPDDCSCKSREDNAAASMLQISQILNNSLRIDDYEVNPGQQVLVPILIENPIELKSFGFDLVFPSGILKFAGIARTDLSNDFLQIDGHEISDGILRVGGYRNDIIQSTSTEALVILIFEVNDQAYGNSMLLIMNTYDDLERMPTLHGSIRVAETYKELNAPEENKKRFPVKKVK